MFSLIEYTGASSIKIYVREHDPNGTAQIKKIIFLVSAKYTLKRGIFFILTHAFLKSSSFEIIDRLLNRFHFTFYVFDMFCVLL